MSPGLGMALAAAIAAPRSSTVEVKPLTVEGELPEEWRDSADAAVRAGLSRGAVQPCDVEPCASDFVVSGDLSIEDRDYTIRLEVRRPGDREIVVSTEGYCELCGVEDAIDEIEARAAILVPKIEQLEASAPLLVFHSTPPGVEVVIDQRSRGVTPVEVEAEPGQHLVEAKHPGYFPQSFEVQAIDGVQQEISLRLVPMPAEPPKSGRALRIAGVASLSAAVVGLAAGVPLLILHGRPYERTCNADPTGRCQFDYDTQTGGVVGVAIGGALAVTGAVLLAVGMRRGRRARAVALGPGGLRF